MTRHLLVIGAQRCGTTYLHSLLDAHPEITMARPSRPEPKVFCSAEASARGRALVPRDLLRARGVGAPAGREEHQLPRGPEPPPLVPPRCSAMPHIVVVLRDPVERAVSNWRFSTQQRAGDPAAGDGAAGEPDARAPVGPGATSVSPFAYLERGRYIDYLAPWLATFPDTMHVRVPRGAASRTRPSCERLWKALGVDPAIRPRAPVESR